jgi:hypothetical protein
MRPTQNLKPVRLTIDEEEAMILDNETAAHILAGWLNRYAVGVRGNPGPFFAKRWTSRSGGYKGYVIGKEDELGGADTYVIS